MSVRDAKSPTTLGGRAILYLAHLVFLWGLLWLLWGVGFSRIDPWSAAGVFVCAVPPLYVFLMPQRYWFRLEHPRTGQRPRLQDARTPSTFIGRLAAYILCVGAASSAYIIVWAATGKILFNPGVIAALLMVLFLFWFFIPERYWFHRGKPPHNR